MENVKPGYYAITPANVRYDKSLTASAKLLYGEITCLTQKEGYCYASNNYFAALYEVTPQAISKWINQLSKNGYIRLEYVKEGKEIKERKIFLQGINSGLEVSTNIDRGINKSLIGYQQKFKGNNTSNNNTSNNIYTSPKTSKQFKAPTYEEIEDFCKEKGYYLDDIQYFMDWYDPGHTGVWRFKNKTPVKDWKKCVVTWSKNNKASSGVEIKDCF